MMQLLKKNVQPSIAIVNNTYVKLSKSSGRESASLSKTGPIIMLYGMCSVIMDGAKVLATYCKVRAPVYNGTALLTKYGM